MLSTLRTLKNRLLFDILSIRSMTKHVCFTVATVLVRAMANVLLTVKSTVFSTTYAEPLNDMLQRNIYCIKSLFT